MNVWMYSVELVVQVDFGLDFVAGILLFSIQKKIEKNISEFETRKKQQKKQQRNNKRNNERNNDKLNDFVCHKKKLTPIAHPRLGLASR